MSSKKSKGVLSAVIQIAYANAGQEIWELADVRRVHATRGKSLARAIALMVEEEIVNLHLGTAILEEDDTPAAKLRLVVEIDWRSADAK